jgi:uncharacterized protein
VRSLFDVNMLLALFHPEHVHHSPAHEWWSANRSQGWASCPLTQNGFVRVASQPRNPKPLRVSEALGLLFDEIAGTDHAFWPDDISLLDEQRIDRSHVLGPRQLTDVYLLALAVKHGGRLVTFDRSIPMAAVREAKVDHMVLL